jgi:hypothetical protein
MLKLTKKDLSDVSVVALILANAVPLYGVAFLKWNAGAVILLYWAENLIVGFYNILRMALVRVPNPVDHLRKLFMIPFFAVHYGGFTAVHGGFVMVFFRGLESGFPEPASGREWPCFLVFLQLLIAVVQQAWSVLPPGAKPVLLILFLSHGVSFVQNFIINGEYKTTDVEKLMGRPYSRIIVLHVAIIFGGFLTMLLGSPMGVLIVLVIVKTIADLKLHLRSHRKRPKSASEPRSGPTKKRPPALDTMFTDD